MPVARVIEIARAKVNLSLHVLGRRADGYHEISSIVAFADLGDRLTLEPAAEFSLEVIGAFAGDVPQDETNSVLRAVRYLAEAQAGQMARVRIVLEKNIPVAAGLGGGSADAAAALRGLSRLNGIALPAQSYRAIAQRLGADVPVCMASRPSRMTGIGDVLEPSPFPASGPMLLVNPGIALSTASVFSELGLKPGESLSSSIDEANDIARNRNDLTAPAIRLAPVIGEVLERISTAEGATLARMSGSGATCFGLFATSQAAQRAAEAIRADHAGWWCAATNFS